MIDRRPRGQARPAGARVVVSGAGEDDRQRHAEHYDADLRRRLQRLPRQQQVVLALRYYLDLTDAEIADSMSCSVGTVRGYASRALATLRTMTVIEAGNTERHAI